MNHTFRIVFFLISAVLFLSFYSCNSSEKNEKDISPSETEQLNTENQSDENQIINNDNVNSEINIDETNNNEILNEEIVANGKVVFKNKGCIACHTIGKGKLVGPDLLGVTKIREEQWLRDWLKSPDKMLQTDPIAKELLKEHLVPMPNQNLTDDEVEAIIAYMKSEDNR